MKRFNLAQVNAELDNMLLRAQCDLEDVIEAFGEAVDEHAEAEARYRKTRGDTVRRLREEGIAATLIGDIVKGATAELKAESLRAEGLKAKCKLMAAAIELRINSLKFVGKRTDALADNQMGEG